jgi:hypothetical protein
VVRLTELVNEDILRQDILTSLFRFSRHG